MPTATGGNGAFTPSTSVDNWTLDSSNVSNIFGKVIAIAWGGRETTSTAYRTRWHRPVSSSTSTFTTLSPAFHNPNFSNMSFRLGQATSPGTLQADPGGNLYAQDWNGQGGVGMIVMPLANPWWIVGTVSQGQIGCRNVAGVTASASSYEISWEE